MSDFDNAHFFSTSDKEKSGKIGVYSSHRTRWVEDVCELGEQQGLVHLAESGVSHVGSSFTSGKRNCFVSFIAVGLFILLIRLFYLQIYSGNRYRFLAENNSERVLSIPAERGLIYDARGRQLTENIPNFSLTISPRSLPRRASERSAIISRLADVTGESPGSISSIIDQYAKYSLAGIVIHENIDYETAMKIYIAGAELPGFNVIRGSKRLYLNYKLPRFGFGEPTLDKTTMSNPNSLSSIVGYVGKLDADELKKFYSEGYLMSDVIGKVGVEKTHETDLRGVYGKRRVEVNAQGNEQSTLAESAPSPGLRIELSIDVALQEALERSLLFAMGDAQKRASAVAIDPRNGRVLALVSLPAFDNNDFSVGIEKEKYAAYLQDENKPLFNRAISGLYPTGSTIKPVLAAAALAQGIIKRDTTVLSIGGINVGQWWFPDWQAGGHGLTDVVSSLAWSVNTFYYYIGGGYGSFSGLGIDKIINYFKLFGFGAVTGIDLIGEESGFIPSPQWKKKTKNESWYIGDTYNLSIGQGDLLATPLQVAVMTAAVANGGTLYSPRVVAATVNAQNGVKNVNNPVILRDHFINDDHLQIVRAGMRACVTYGSCRRLSGLPFAVAGKTGTAQWNSGREPHAWFTSFAPYDQPEIVLTILIEEGVEGSATAVPAAESFYRFWWSYRQLISDGLTS